MRLKVSDVPEFKGAYQRINDYFSEIATLLNASDSKETNFTIQHLNDLDH